MIPKLHSYVIHSESEGGYWSNEMGWMKTPDDASLYTIEAARRIKLMPPTENKDATWVLLPNVPAQSTGKGAAGGPVQKAVAGTPDAMSDDEERFNKLYRGVRNSWSGD